MTKTEIATAIKNMRLAAGKTQSEVACALGRKQPIVGHWESGYAKPDINTLFQLCEICGTTVDAAFGLKKRDSIISKEDTKLLKRYHALDNIGKMHIREIIDWETDRINILSLIKSQVNSPDQSIDRSDRGNIIPYRKIQYYQKIASAGIGDIIWDDLLADDIEIPDNNQTKDGDFVIGIDGDSMEPLFWDTDMVVVQKTDKIELGEIGVFTLDGVCLIKELGENQLISHNPVYPPILFNEDSNIKCMGRVLCNLIEHSNDEIEYMSKRKEYIRNYNEVYHIAAANGLNNDEETHILVNEVLSNLEGNHNSNE